MTIIKLVFRTDDFFYYKRCVHWYTTFIIKKYYNFSRVQINVIQPTTFKRDILYFAFILPFPNCISEFINENNWIL